MKITSHNLNHIFKKAHARHPKARDALLGPKRGLMEYLNASPKQQRKWDREMQEAREELAKVEEEIRSEVAALVAAEGEP